MLVTTHWASQHSFGDIHIVSFGQAVSIFMLPLPLLTACQIYSESQAEQISNGSFIVSSKDAMQEFNPKGSAASLSGGRETNENTSNQIEPNFKESSDEIPTIKHLIGEDSSRKPTNSFTKEKAQTGLIIGEPTSYKDETAVYMVTLSHPCLNKETSDNNSTQDTPYFISDWVGPKVFYFFAIQTLAYLILSVTMNIDATAKYSYLVYVLLLMICILMRLFRIWHYNFIYRRNTVEIHRQYEMESTSIRSVEASGDGQDSGSRDGFGLSSLRQDNGHTIFSQETDSLDAANISSPVRQDTEADFGFFPQPHSADEGRNKGL
ncbi:hypothetical protein B0J11DRAFT_610064 [Dendryphion nanum]|uniref:Uncharacterized protein n=1 Tax=Dendryphion nanum TaxID=256645 RepID=A0A9P9EJC0_9PLEO|nr:hypothetical protein B0J11DRAFT_610064 [Dendryphion nanum]